MASQFCIFLKKHNTDLHKLHVFSHSTATYIILISTRVTGPNAINRQLFLDLKNNIVTYQQLYLRNTVNKYSQITETHWSLDCCICLFHTKKTAFQTDCWSKREPAEEQELQSACSASLVKKNG